MSWRCQVATYHNSISLTPNHAPSHTASPAPVLTVLDSSTQHYSVHSTVQQDSKLWKSNGSCLSLETDRPTKLLLKDSCHHHFSSSHIPPTSCQQDPHSISHTRAQSGCSFRFPLSSMLTVATPPHTSISSLETTFHIDATIIKSPI